jgi:hypothetical protein
MDIQDMWQWSKEIIQGKAEEKTNASLSKVIPNLTTESLLATVFVKLIHEEEDILKLWQMSVTSYLDTSGIWLNPGSKALDVIAPAIIQLPLKLIDFAGQFTKRKCSKHNDTSNSLMVCLICGYTVCKEKCGDLRSYEDGMGNLNLHAKAKHCNMTIWLELRDLSVTLMAEGSIAILDEKMYTDEIAQCTLNKDMNQETKQQLEKFKLNFKLYEYLKNVAVNNRIYQELYFEDLKGAGRRFDHFVFL